MSKGKRNREKRKESFKKLKLKNYSSEILSINYNRDGSANVSYDYVGISRLYKKYGENMNFLHNERAKLFFPDSFEEFLAFTLIMFIDVERIGDVSVFSSPNDLVIDSKQIAEYYRLYELDLINRGIA